MERINLQSKELMQFKNIFINRGTRNIFSILTLLSASSCEILDEKIIHYSYNGVQVTRVDKGTISRFYYGNCDNVKTKCINNAVTIDWSSESFLFGFILFMDDSKVEIIDGGGGKYMSHDNVDSKLFTRKYDFTDKSPIEPYRNKEYDNLFQISNDLELENSRNMQFGSNVKVVYPH